MGRRIVAAGKSREAVSKKQMLRLMGCAARAVPSEQSRQQLCKMLECQVDLSAFLKLAEQNGMGPLLHQHLEAADVEGAEILRTALRGCVVRHRLAQRTAGSWIAKLAASFTESGIRALVLKGGALSRMVYSLPEHRPMRDIDILVGREDEDRSVAVLLEYGFRVVSAEPKDGHHLPAMQVVSGGMKVSVELHRHLGMVKLPSHERRKEQQLSELWPKRQTVEIEGVDVATLGREDMLRHVFRHGLASPFDWEFGRVICMADVVSMVEAWCGVLDWDQLEFTDPDLVAALPLLHFVTPWSDAALEYLQPLPKRRPLGVQENYYGWPRWPAPPGVLERLRYGTATLLPSEWWLRVRHGGASTRSLPRCWAAHMAELAGYVRNPEESRN